MVEPEPERKPPRAPASVPAWITSSRKGMRGLRKGWWNASWKASLRRSGFWRANAAVMRQALALLWTAARRSSEVGRTFRASGVETSKGGMRRMKERWSGTGNRATRPPEATVNPPKAAGAALSGWPSREAQMRKRSSMDRGESVSALRAPRRPRRTVTELPRPREVGISPSMDHWRLKRGRAASLKKAATACSAMDWAGAGPSIVWPGARVEVTVTRFARFSAMPRQS